MVHGIILGVVALLVLSMQGSYNGLVNQRENVQRTFANAQEQYQREADLVPNLVSTFKGAALGDYSIRVARGWAIGTKKRTTPFYCLWPPKTDALVLSWVMVSKGR